MGNEQSVEGQAVPEMGLRLSTLCRYLSESGNDEGLGFSWFQASTDVSGLVLRGAHRWGYVLSYVGGQRLFKDTRQRFFVLLDHYFCYFDSHAPETRMRGSIDLDKTQCHLELLPRAPDRTDGGGANGNSSFGGDDGSGEEHRVEVTSKADESSIVLCFATATSLQDWMKSIFDVQQRKATFSPLRHNDGAKEGDSEIGADLGGGRGGWMDVGLPGLSRGGYHRRRMSANDAGGGGDVLGPLSRPPPPPPQGAGESSAQLRRRRRRGWRRGTLESPPPRSPLASSPSPSYRGRVPSSWAEEIESADGSSPRVPPQAPPASSVFLGKASERLAHLPRGGRAAGGDGINSSLDEYGAFTTAHASIFEGWTRGLQPHGWGRMVFANGDCVEGWWEHDVLEGSGEHTSREEGWTYRGGYVAGERHGPGRLDTDEGDVWECEWRHGVVASGGSGTHATLGGELYQGGCGPSAENPQLPCRTGHGRLRRRNGEQVETQFRAGRAVDAAKGVVRFRNGAIFFGELKDARPHGYGELYLSSVKPEGRTGRCRSLAELDEMARDVLWYKGDFRLGKPHGTGLVKYKDPPVARRPPTLVLPPPRPVSLPVALRSGLGNVLGSDGGDVGMPAAASRAWGDSKEGEEEQEDEDDGGESVEVSLALSGTTDEDEEDYEDTSDSDEEEEDDEEVERGHGEGEGDAERGGGGGEGRTAGGGERRHADNREGLPGGGEEKATPGVSKPGQRPPVGGGADLGGSGADMEYEADFVEGVMVRRDPSHLRLAALRFGRAEIRRLDTLLRQEEEAMSRLRSRGLCLLCNTEEMNALLVSCRHRVLCMGCASRADCCPVCREPIGKVVKTYST